MKKFDLIEALKDKGFEVDYKMLAGDRLQVRLIKEYRVSERINDWGILDTDFWADIKVSLDPNGVPELVTADFSNGKHQHYSYNKRTYNAIRETVKYNGFEL